MSTFSLHRGPIILCSMCMANVAAICACFAYRYTVISCMMYLPDVGKRSSPLVLSKPEGVYVYLVLINTRTGGGLRITPTGGGGGI